MSKLEKGDLGFVFGLRREPGSMVAKIMYFGADGELRQDEFRYNGGYLLAEVTAPMHYVALNGGKPLEEFAILSNREAKKRNPTRYRLIEKACGGTRYAGRTPRRPRALHALA